MNVPVDGVFDGVPVVFCGVVVPSFGVLVVGDGVGVPSGSS